MKKCGWICVMFSLFVLLLAGCAGGGGEEKVSYQDGSYEAESAKDDRGAYGTITVIIENGKITAADYEEIQSDGTPKGEDYSYQTSVDAQPKYEAELVEKQNPDKVETVSGATSTWNKFKEAAKGALDKAKK